MQTRSLSLAALLLSFAGTALAAPGDYSAEYSSTFGPMKLQVKGDPNSSTDVPTTGSYPQYSGTFHGKSRNNRFDGVWVQPTSERTCNRSIRGSRYWGTVTFDGLTDSRVKGHWAYCDDAKGSGGAWNATRTRHSRKAAPAPSSGGGGGDGMAAVYAGRSSSQRDNKLYFFIGDHYSRWDITTDRLENGYPKNLKRQWPGLPDHLDAATYAGRSASGRDNKLYLFKGAHYWRWDIVNGRLDKGYPKRIAKGWPGIPDHLDAAVYAGRSASSRDNKLYFFKGDRYWRWDIERDRLDAGYPKRIAAAWPGIPDNLTGAVYAGVSNSARNNKLYFFKGGEYWRWDIERHQLDNGYPRASADGWRGVK